MVKKFSEEDFSKNLKTFLNTDLLNKSAKFNRILCLFILGLSLLNLVITFFSLDVYFDPFLVQIIENYTYNPIFYILITLSLFLINSRNYKVSIFNENSLSYKIINYSLVFLVGVYCICSLVSFMGIHLVNGFGPQFQDTWIFLIIFYLYFFALLLMVLKRNIRLTQILGACIFILGFIGGLYYYSGKYFFALALNYLFYVVLLPYLFITSYPELGLTKLFYLNTDGSKFTRKVIVIVPIILALSSGIIVVLDHSIYFNLINVSALMVGVSIASLFLVMIISNYKFTKTDIYGKVATAQIQEASKEAFLLKNNLETIQGITKVAIGNWDSINNYKWSSELFHILEIEETDFDSTVDLLYEFAVDGGKTEYYSKIQSVNQCYDTILKIKTALGNIKYLSIYKVSEIGENGNIISKTFFVQDVSEDVLKEQNLAQAVKDNQILLKEVHHRVKNNMQIINSLLSIQSFKIKDDYIKEIIIESQKRIRAMALVHEHLYQYEDFGNININ